MRYFIELSYNGKNYHGWQVQPNANSVQEEVNKAFSLIFRVPVNVTAAGRTDAGVHASQMLVHFDLEKRIDENTYLYKLNSILPDEIAVHRIYRVNDDAHARFDATSRSYEYRIWLGYNPFLLDTTWQIHRQKININKMNEAALLLLNYTNFKCFSRSKTDVKTYNCDVGHAEWKQEGNLLVFHITADRFLRNMVRAIVGTLVDIGLGKTSIEEFKGIIESQNRCNAGPSVPAHGLFLTKITYPESIRHE